MTIQDAKVGDTIVDGELGPIEILEMSESRTLAETTIRWEKGNVRYCWNKQLCIIPSRDYSVVPNVQ